MNDCQHFGSSDERLSAYHDGQLDAVARDEVRRHVEGCLCCTARLAELVRVSQLFIDAPVPRFSQIGLRRVHAKVELLFDRGLLQLARVMTGIAAMILVAGSLWLIRPRPSAPMTESVTQMALQLEEPTPGPLAEPGPSDWIVAELSH